MVERVDLPAFSRAASTRPATVDEKRRTVEIVWTSGARVRRHSFFGGGFDEELSLEDGAIRLHRLNNGAALLNSHQARDLARVIGVVEGAWLTGDGRNREGRAVVRFSERQDVEPVWQDVRAGILRNISVGYITHRAVKTERENDIPLVRAVDWEPLELSLVAVPADAQAQVRAADEHFPCQVENVTMAVDLVDQHGAPIRSAPIADDPLPADPVLAERERVRRIGEMGRTLGVSQEAQALINRGIDADTAWTTLLDVRGRREDAEAAIRVSGGADFSDPSAIGERMRDALLHRCDPGRYALPESAREFAHRSLVDLRRTLLEAQGVRARGLSADDVLDARPGGWLGSRAGGFETTSDLPYVVSAVSNKLLEDSYMQAASPLKSHSRERSATDFKSLYNIKVGTTATLAEVTESAEVTRGYAAEAREAFAVKTYARIWPFSRQLIINDDLSALSDWATEMGIAAAETENGLFVALLSANSGVGPILDDGVNLFDAAHGNVSTGGAAPDATTLAAGRLAMRQQTSVGGTYPIQVAPSALLVGPANETAAEQIVATIQPVSAATVNPFAGRLTVEVEPRFGTSKRWYLVAQNMPFQHAYLNGRRGPQILTRDGFDVLGIEMRCLIDFGCGVRDYRYIYTNAGE